MQSQYEKLIDKAEQYLPKIVKQTMIVEFTYAKLKSKNRHLVLVLNPTVDYL